MKHPQDIYGMVVGNDSYERVKQFKYLRSSLQSSEVEIKTRIQAANKSCQ